MLRAHLVRRREEKLQRRWRALPRPLFCSTTGGYPDPSGVRQAFRHVCVKVEKKAGLTRDQAGADGLLHLVARFTPPTASATPTRPSTSKRGRTSYYVSRMLGHADISLTVHTYGAWLQLHRRTGRGGGAGGAGVMPLANAASRRLLAAVTGAAPLASSLPAPDAVCKQAARLLPACPVQALDFLSGPPRI